MPKFEQHIPNIIQHIPNVHLGRRLAFIIVQPITNLTGVSRGELETKCARKMQKTTMRMIDMGVGVHWYEL